MTDKKKKSSSEEEYQFPSDEFIHSAAPEEDEAVDHEQTSVESLDADHDDYEEETVSRHTSGLSGIADRFPLLKNKRVLGAVGLAVVALIAFAFISPSRHTKVVKVQQPKVVAPPVQTVSTPNPQVVGQLAGLQQTAQADKLTINQLQGQLQGMHSMLNQANGQTQQMAHMMLKMSHQVTVLTTAVKRLEQRDKPKTHKVLPPPIHYNVKAILPGRAWIKGSNGTTETVAVGDPIKQYGTVTAINAQRGEVFTTSGKVITLGVNDY